MLLRSIMCFVCGFLGLVLAGCAGWAGPQQPRLEIAESAGSFIVRHQGLFLSLSRLTVAKSADGTLSVRSLPGNAEKWAQPISPPDAALSGLEDALLPFLVPACEAPAARPSR